MKVVYKKAVLKNFAIFTGEQLRWSLFLVKLQAEKRLQLRCFPMHSDCFWLFFCYSNLFVFGCLFTINYDPLWWRMFIEIRLCNPMTDVSFKGHDKIVKIYMVKFNISVLKELRNYNRKLFLCPPQK